jgi:hypothetical protein
MRISGLCDGYFTGKLKINKQLTNGLKTNMVEVSFDTPAGK